MPALLDKELEARHDIKVLPDPVAKFRHVIDEMIALGFQHVTVGEGDQKEKFLFVDGQKVSAAQLIPIHEAGQRRLSVLHGRLRRLHQGRAAIRSARAAAPQTPMHLTPPPVQTTSAMRRGMGTMLSPGTSTIAPQRLSFSPTGAVHHDVSEARAMRRRELNNLDNTIRREHFQFTRNLDQHCQKLGEEHDQFYGKLDHVDSQRAALHQEEMYSYALELKAWGQTYEEIRGSTGSKRTNDYGLAFHLYTHIFLCS
jgi:hypothetical protein